MSEKIKPALTPEEWAARGIMRPAGLSHTLCAFRRRGGKLDVGLVGHEGSSTIHPQHAHAVAALLLNGQPFGFTWEMVDALRDAVECAESPDDYPLALKAVGLVEALLAPREAP